MPLVLFLLPDLECTPDQPAPRVTMAVGSLGLNSIIRRGRAAYFPARVVREHLESGALSLVSDAPTFAFPCYVVYHADMDADARDAALATLEEVVADVDAQQDGVLDALADISAEEPTQMGA